MVRKTILFLLAILSLVLAGGCLSNLEDTTTMSVRLTWDPAIGDCDLGILEPDNVEYYPTSLTTLSSSPNGFFSPDSPNGGPETWTLKKYHQTGKYKPLVYSWSGNNVGEIRIEITINGITGIGVEEINPNELLQFLDYGITRNATGGTLRYTLIRQQIEGRPPKVTQ